MCNQMMTSEIREEFYAHFCPNPILGPFYLLILWLTNYVGNQGFLISLSWLVTIENATSQTF